MKSCPVCGKTYSEGMFCEDCGVMLVDQQPVVNPPVQNSGKSGNNTTKIIIAVMAVLLVATIAVAAYFAIRSLNGNNDTDAVTPEPNSAAAEAVVDDVPVDDNADNADENLVAEQDEIVPVTTTMPETTTQMFVNKMTEQQVYETFYDFYCSYLDAINSFDASYMYYCTPQVRSEMAERFSINKKSLFVMDEIQYDQKSLRAQETYNGATYTFYAKCATILYDRYDYDYKKQNYSCWKVTVTYSSGSYVISDMERDDDHKMSTDIYKITNMY